MRHMESLARKLKGLKVRAIAGTFGPFVVLVHYRRHKRGYSGWHIAEAVDAEQRTWTTFFDGRPSRAYGMDSVVAIEIREE